MKPLTVEQVKILHLPATVWMEECGGYDGCRCRAEMVQITEMSRDCATINGMRDGKCTWAGGRTWRFYNKQYGGWRIWPHMPTDAERLEAKWDA